MDSKDYHKVEHPKSQKGLWGIGRSSKPKAFIYEPYNNPPLELLPEQQIEKGTHTIFAFELP